jgi:hypothetical protein
VELALLLLLVLLFERGAAGGLRLLRALGADLPAGKVTSAGARPHSRVQTEAAVMCDRHCCSASTDHLVMLEKQHGTSEQSCAHLTGQGWTATTDTAVVLKDPLVLAVPPQRSITPFLGCVFLRLLLPP